MYRKEKEMYQGQNPSALRSMKWLSDALLELLTNEKYNQITIRQICQKADLSRQTFYKIFESKEEVMQYHFSIMFQEFSRKCDLSQNITLSKIVHAFFSFFYEQRNFIRILITNNMVFLLEQQFEVYLQKISLFRSINDKEPYGDYTTAYIAGALTQILVHWFERSFDLSIEELSNLTESIITGQTLSESRAI